MPRARNTGTPVTHRPEDTRAQRDRQKAEQEQAAAERQDQLTMINATETADDRDGLWDPQDGTLVESGMDPQTEEQLRRYMQIPPSEGDDVIPEEDALSSSAPSQQVRSDGPRVGPLGTLIDPETIEEMNDDVVVSEADYTPARPGLQVARAEKKERKRIVRINADLDPTIGQGPNSQWHFKKGRRYEVPERVAFHLHEKGYVSSWG